MWKWFVGGFLALVLLCGAGGWFLSSSEQFKSIVNPPEKPVEVRLETVAIRDLVRTVGAPGNIEPKSNVMLSAQVSARISELPYEEGDAVEAGAVVVQLDDEDLQAALESAEANLKVQQAMHAEAEVGLGSAEASLRSEHARLEGAQAALAEATADVGRVRELFDTKDRSQADLQRAEASFQQQEANVKIVRAAVEVAEQNVKRAHAGVLGALASIEVSRAQIRRSRKDLANTTITTPISGIITTLDKEEGELVVVGTLNNPASVLMEIADLSEMLFQARVDEANVTSVEPGQDVDVYINAYGDKVFKGVVRKVGQQRLTHTDGTYFFETEIVVRLEEGQTLRSGLTASCEIYVETIPDAMQVPSQAVLSRRISDLPKEIVEGSELIDDRKTFTYVVYTVAGDRARVTPVVIGASDLKNTVIEAGLAEGDRVIAGPYKILEELKHEQLIKSDDIAAGEMANVLATDGGAIEEPTGG